MIYQTIFFYLQRISQANQANRAKQTMVARVGTMSIARNIHHMVIFFFLTNSLLISY